MKLFNTLSGKKEELNQKDNYVRMYACGPTVYNFFHVGNARCFVVFDFLRRYLEFRGNKVDFVQNFTDIDDKLIKRAKEENTTVKDVAEKYITEYYKDAQGLGIKAATVHPRATENIDSIISIISTLIEKGFAYERNGDVYFSSRKFNEYGKLSKINIDELESGARVEIGDVKEDPLDFALWKAKKEGEPFWQSPWGEGRPGWHIECSAMVDKYLGKTIDIHCGGADLSFPHHENEIAQSEAAFGVPFARFWIHNGYINVDNKKMSKSLNNFFTVREAAEKYGYDAIRFFLLSAHYRSPVNFSQDALTQAQNALSRLYNFEDNLRFLIQNSNSGEIDTELLNKAKEFENEYIKVLDDDLNSADAIASVFELVKFVNVNSSGITKETAQALFDIYEKLCSLLGFMKPKSSEEISDEDVLKLIEERANAKKEKNYAKADEIRNMLKEKKVILEDTPSGVKFKRI